MTCLLLLRTFVWVRTVGCASALTLGSSDCSKSSKLPMKLGACSGGYEPWTGLRGKFRLLSFGSMIIQICVLYNMIVIAAHREDFAL